MICKKCNIDQPHTEKFFSYFNNGKNKKLRKTCRKCSVDPDKIKIYNDLYYQKNKKILNEKQKQYNSNHQEEHRKYNLDYYKNNKKRINISRKLYMRKRRKENLFKLIDNMRGRIHHAIVNGYSLKTKKSMHTRELLGCSINELKNYLENKFQEGMSWDNYGKYGWHIDHIKPCISYDLSKLEEQKKCFHYTNLQPLWATDNLKKGAKEIRYGV